jgi:hypothetical protein
MNTATEFAGLSGEMREATPWLSAEDLMGRGEVAVTIEKVIEHRNVKFQAGRTKEKAFAVAFVGKQRQLVLNATNRKTLAQMYGAKVADWKGKAITLVVGTTELKGEQVPCIRIKKG